MTKQEFTEKLLKWMEMRTGKEYKICESLKANTKYIGITLDILESVSPILFVEPFYERYLNTEISFEGVACMFEFQFYMSCNMEEPLQSVLSEFQDRLFDYEYAKDKIIFQIINKEKNEELLNSTVYQSIGEGELAIVYRVCFGNIDNGVTSTLITKNLLKEWGQESIDHQLAVENTVRIFPLEAETLYNTVKHFISDEIHLSEAEIPEYQPIVVSNKTKTYGASVILYPTFREQISNLIKEDFYIIPSSVHELILYPKTLTNLDEALRMVRDINQTLFSEDFLSNSIYEFNKYSQLVVAR